MLKGGRKSSVGLRIIAIGKLLKVITLLVVGILALTLASGGAPPETFRHWLDAMQIDEGSRWARRVLSKMSGVSSEKLGELGVGSFVYAALFSIEGVGLWLEKRWAEWFTIGITISFIPLELYEIGKEPTAPRIVTLILNVAVLVYLALRVRRERKPIAKLQHALESPKAAFRSMMR